MGQVLRITFDNIDYNYQLLNTSPVSRETQEISIQVADVIYTLVRQNGQWLPQETAKTGLTGLLTAIGRALALRYRI